MNKNKKELGSAHLKWRKTRKNRPVSLSYNYGTSTSTKMKSIYTLEIDNLIVKREKGTLSG